VPSHPDSRPLSPDRSIVDAHTFFFPEAWPDLDLKFGGPPWPWLRRTGPDTGTLMLGNQPFQPCTASLWDMARRTADMDAQSVGHQVLCAHPLLLLAERPPAQALFCAKVYNDAALKACEADKARFTPLAQVPLQDADLACRELERALQGGHKGVQIANHVGGRDLDDPGLITFLQHCDSLGAPVYVMPWSDLGGQRLRRHLLDWSIGLPAEIHLSIAAMILGGAFEALPKSLRLCFASGGGAFPYMLGRLEQAWRRRDVARGRAPRPPGAYLDRFCVDADVGDARALRLLVDVMGPERILLGSGYPSPLAEQPVGGLVREAAFLDEAARTAILQGNARAFLEPSARTVST